MNQDSLRKARLWLAVVFLVGGAIGAVFGYSFGSHIYAAPKQSQPTAMSEPERRAKRVADMTKELGLTPDQSAKMDEIIRGAHQEMKGIRDKAESDVDAVREKARNEMRGYLTPEQKPKFEELVQKMDAERKKQGGPGK
ncbi:MAG: Spy/CpxP family protein refolding chaperone [Candidatus Acidiferrum sp.]